MGLIDEIKASFGDDFFDRKTPGTSRRNWTELCVCGHLDRYHSPSSGGAYRIPKPTVQTMGGEKVTTTTVFAGCVGAMPGRGFQVETVTADRDAHTGMVTLNPTCPCTELRAVVTVDRPNRYFNQRMPVDRTDHARHPFMVGIRAFMTHLSRRKQAMANPDWYAEEFDRRFVWVEGKRVCGISRCRQTEDVWPVFISPDVDDRSELRCAKHR